MMDRQLKQRVVGAGLLVAFGVIFIPIFLDNGGVESPVPPSMNIPPAPTEDVSQRAPALGDDTIAAMEAQADEDVALPPSRVQSGEGSTAEPTPLNSPSASGEAPLEVDTVEDGVVLEEGAQGVDETVIIEPPRMQPPEPRVSPPEPPVRPPTETRPAAVVAPEPPAKARPAPESRPAPMVSETRTTPKPVETKAVAKPPETRSATKAVDTRTSVKPPEPRPDTRTEAKPVVATKVVEPKPPTVAAATIPTVGSWTVQLGSFASDLNAKKLVDKLKAAGYKAYTEPRLEQGATVFKVRVGPTPGKAEAERLRQRIETQFEARGMLVPAR